MSNSEIARQLLQQLNVVHDANERLKALQRKEYVVTVNCQTDGSSTGHFMLHPNFIEKSGKGHSEIPVGGGKSEVWEAFTGLPLSILDNISKDQNETDVRIRQKLSAGLDKAARILNEISELHATSARKESYYSDWWQKKCAQWAHEAKLKVIWDNDPHLPLFGASEILAGRDPYDPANKFSPDAARANASRNEAAARRNAATQSSGSGYDVAPWALQAENDAIEARNRRIEKKNFEYDQANGCGGGCPTRWYHSYPR